MKRNNTTLCLALLIVLIPQTIFAINLDIRLNTPREFIIPGPTPISVNVSVTNVIATNVFITSIKVAKGGFFTTVRSDPKTISPGQNVDIPFEVDVPVIGEEDGDEVIIAIEAVIFTVQGETLDKVEESFAFVAVDQNMIRPLEMTHPILFVHGYNRSPEAFGFDVSDVSGNPDNIETSASRYFAPTDECYTESKPHERCSTTAYQFAKHFIPNFDVPGGISNDTAYVNSIGIEAFNAADRWAAGKDELEYQRDELYGRLEEVLNEYYDDEWQHDLEKKVVLICHSQGGLLAKLAFMHYKDSSVGNPMAHIERVVTFGTPYRGSPWAINNNFFPYPWGVVGELLNEISTKIGVFDPIPIGPFTPDPFEDLRISLTGMLKASINFDQNAAWINDIKDPKNIATNPVTGEIQPWVFIRSRNSQFLDQALQEGRDFLESWKTDDRWRDYLDLSEFSVVLSDPGSDEGAVIEVVRAITGLTLDEATELVLAAYGHDPVLVKENVTPNEAFVIQKMLTEAGASTQLESSIPDGKQCPQAVKTVSDFICLWSETAYPDDPVRGICKAAWTIRFGANWGTLIYPGEYGEKGSDLFEYCPTIPEEKPERRMRSFLNALNNKFGLWYRWYNFIGDNHVRDLCASGLGCGGPWDSVCKTTFGDIDVCAVISSQGKDAVPEHPYHLRPIAEKLQEYKDLNEAGDLIVPWESQSLYDVYPDAVRDRHVFLRNYEGIWHSDEPKQYAIFLAALNESTLKNVNAYFPELTPKSKDVEIIPDANSICAPGFSAGTVTIRARFENTSTDTTLSNLAFKVKELSDGSILCNTDGAPGGEGTTLEVARQGDYTDGLLGAGEYFYQSFEVGLKDMVPFTVFLDLLGVIAIDETAPSLIQSNLGPEDNNLEVVVRGTDGQLHQYFRKKVSEDEFEWLEGSIPFAPGATSAPSLIQSTLPEGNNLRVVVRGADRKLHHYVREENAAGELFWDFVEIIRRAGDVTSAPSLIQSTLGPEENNLELVVRGADGQLHQYFREKDDEGNYVWEEGSIPFAAGATSAPSLIKSNLGRDENNLEVSVRGPDGQVHHYVREKDDEGNFVWEEGSIPFAAGATSAPSLIQSTLGGGEGNFEVAVRQDDNRLHTYVRLRDDQGPWFWEFVDFVEPAENVTSAPSLIQSNLGPQEDNFELVVREGGKVRHYFRERIGTEPDVYEWRFGGDVTQ